MIQLENVSKHFIENDNQKVVLNNLSFSINKGEIFGLVGKSGSGKSTLLRLMNGYITPDNGKIYLLGQHLTKKNNNQLVKKTSTIFQSFNLLSNLNVIDNVLLPIKLRGLNKKDYYNRAKQLLEFVGLNDLEYNYIKTLSGGEKQRVAIARALITNPDVIFCDEPTSALDDIVSYDVLSLLNKINKEFNTTIVIVSHNINVIKSVCHKVLILDEGEIVDIVTNQPNFIKPLSYKEAFNNV